jgi:hypothetical protein
MSGAFSNIGLDACTKLDVYDAWGTTMQKINRDAADGWKASCTRNCTVNEWTDRSVKPAACRPKAQMAVLTSSEIAVLEMNLYKSETIRTVSRSIELRLKSGGVLADADHRISWAAAVGSVAGWLSLSTLNGVVDSSASTAEVHATASGTGLGDTATTGPITTNITFHSSATLMKSSDFVNGTNKQTITVRLNIFAVPYVTETHVTIIRSSGDPVRQGESVEAGDQLTVTVHAFDAEGLPIVRAEVPLRLDVLGNLNKNHSTPLAQTGSGTNTYKARIPELWVREPETVQSEVFAASCSQRKAAVGCCRLLCPAVMPILASLLDRWAC